MGNHLLVSKLISLGALNDIVQDQDGSVIAGFEDEDILILGFFVVDDVLDLESHRLAGPHLRNLAEPAIWRRSFVSLIVLRVWGCGR